MFVEIATISQFSHWSKLRRNHINSVLRVSDSVK